MADNETTGSAKAVATRKVTYSGDANQNVQVVGLGVFAGSDDAKTVADVDASNGLPVNIQPLSAAIDSVAIEGKASGGLSIFRSIDLDETEEEVKATAGTLYAIHAFNTTASILYLKVYNATAATVVVGTTTPVLTLPIPGNNDTDGAGFVWNIPQGLAFGTAITVACTTGIADADTGAPAANACIVNLGYK